MKKILLIIAILFFGVTNSYASHLMGAEITYTHISGDDYEVTLVVYRDCSGISLSTTSQNVTFQSASCGLNFSSQLPYIQTNDVSQVCPGQNTTCNGGTVPGTQQFIYRGTVTLTPCADWIMHWNSGTRNPATTNLVNPSTQNLYIQNTLNNVVGVNNNSPQFFALPTPYICVGQLTIYNHAAADSDGDSLYYSLATPLTTPGPPGSPIPFSPGYSQAQPMITSSGVNLNQQTGEMCFTPSQNQISVVSVLIQEFRNGLLIGSQIREMQVIVSATCLFNSNPFAGITPTCNGGGGGMTVTYITGATDSLDPNSISMCPENSVCLTYSFSDPDGNNVDVDTSSISASLPGVALNLNNNNTPNPSLVVCWTPTVLDTGLNVFSIILTDDACPISGIQTFSYDITVLDEVYAGIDDTICNLTQGSQLNASGGSGYTWYNVATGVQIPVSSEFTCNPCYNPIATPTVTTTYYVESSLLGQCKDKDTVIVSVIPNTLNIPPLSNAFFCEGASVSLDGGAGFVSYEWVPSGGSTQTGTFTQGGNYAVIVSDGNCTDTSNVIVITERLKPHPVILGAILVCSNDSTTLSVNSVYDAYLWDTGSNISSTRVAANVGSVLLTVDSNGCSQSTTVTIQSKSVPSTIITGPDSLCPGASANFSSTGGPFNAYLWSPTGSTGKTTNAGVGAISITISLSGCDFTANKTIYSYPSPIADFTINPNTSGQPNIDIVFTDASTGVSSWIWDFDVTNISSNPSNENGPGPFTFVYDNQGTHTVALTVSNSYGCSNSINKDYLIFSEINRPTIITPNNDFQNDNLVFENLDPLLFENHLTVLNRWGTKVFDQDNYKNDWSPTNLNEGTYFYVLSVKLSTKEEIYKGTLTILK